MGKACIVRQYYYNWWTGLNRNQKNPSSTIKQHIQVMHDSKLKSELANNSFTKISEKLKDQYPDATEVELMVKTMDCMKVQFFETQQAISSDDD